MFNLFKKLFKDFYLFTASYSNNVFPDPLSKEDEKWKEVPCEVIIDEISSLQINRLLIDKHVTGKNEWYPLRSKYCCFSKFQ